MGRARKPGRQELGAVPGSGAGVGGVARAEAQTPASSLREFRAALPAAAFRMRPGWLAVAWVPGDDQAGGRRLGLGQCGRGRGRHSGSRARASTKLEEGVGRGAASGR